METGSYPTAHIGGQAKAHGISRDQVVHDVLLAQQPNKRFAIVEELGALTVFLASAPQGGGALGSYHRANKQSYPRRARIPN